MILGTLRGRIRISSAELPMEFSIIFRQWLPNLWEQTSTLSWPSHHLRFEAARQATSTIPIVMTGVGNPVGSGFVKSITEPGGNITGLTNISIEISSKYLEYLRAVVPNLIRVGVLIDPKHPNHPTVLKQVQLGAQATDVAVSGIELRSVHDIEAAFGALQRERLGALIVPPDPTFPIIHRRITTFALGNRLPTMFGQREGVEAGGLMELRAELHRYVQTSGGAG